MTVHVNSSRPRSRSPALSPQQQPQQFSQHQYYAKAPQEGQPQQFFQQHCSAKAPQEGQPQQFSQQHCCAKAPEEQQPQQLSQQHCCAKAPQEPQQHQFFKQQYSARLPETALGQEQQQQYESAAFAQQHQEAAAAGMGTERMSELRVNSRKCIRAAHANRGAAARSPWEPQLGHAHLQVEEKRQGRRAAGARGDYEQGRLPAAGAAAALDGNEQRRHFQTRWQAIDGRMEFCTKRVPGSATVEFNYEFIDRDATYHTWKKMAGGYAPQARSHLECNRFLTVQEDAQRLDTLPVVKNRAPPYANPNGHFEQRLPAKNYSTNSFYSYRIYHPSLHGALDRTLCPRAGEPTVDERRRQKRGCSIAARVASSLQTSSLQPFPTVRSPRRFHTALVGAHQRQDHMYAILQPGAAAATSRAPFTPDFPDTSSVYANKEAPQ